jgi:hypothetical protein
LGKKGVTSGTYGARAGHAMSRAWLVLFMGTMADTFFVDMIFNSVISVGGLVFLTGQQFHELIFAGYIDCLLEIICNIRYHLRTHHIAIDFTEWLYIYYGIEFY